MKKKLWQSVVIQMFIAWLLVVILPAVFMWHERIIQWDFLPTDINSMLAMSTCIFIVTYLLHKISIFPGQRSYIYIFPVWLFTLVGIGAIFLIFRWGYAIYFTAVSILLGIFFSFISISISKTLFKQNIAYVPLGRCKSFFTIRDVNWFKLDKPDIYTLPQNIKIDAIVADLSSSELTDEWQNFLAKQTLSGIAVLNNLQVHESLTGRSPIQHLYENNLGSLLPSRSYLVFKQLFETIIVIISLPVILPIMCITYVLVSVESKGNAIFIQERMGQGGKTFHMYKFRSMVIDAEKHGEKAADINDSRVTPIGRFIRKTRIDELPQIINVLKGEMSLIGPRPEQRSMIERSERSIPFYSYRHIVKPGMTGWAQVMQGYTVTSDEYQLKTQYDFYYIKHFSFTLDMLIVIKTAQILFTGFGAR